MEKYSNLNIITIKIRGKNKETNKKDNVTTSSAQ